jgi:hypothetical protein
MGQRYWVIGGEYRNCQFDEVVPGTEEISGPFPDPLRARMEWQRLTFRDHSETMRRYVITQESRV